MSKSAPNISIAAYQNNGLTTFQKLGLAIGFIGLFILTLAFLMFHFHINRFGLAFR